MATPTMTEKQRAAHEALQAAQRQGKTLTQFAKEHGLAIRELYDALACLRRKGLLPRSERKRRQKFIAVRVTRAEPMPRTVGTVCRIVSGDGYVIECSQWPPASWLATLARHTADAAT